MGKRARRARTALSKLLRRVASGEEVIIGRGGHPVARPAPAEGPPMRLLGQDCGWLDIPEDFDAPLDEDLLRAFER